MPPGCTRDADNKPINPAFSDFYEAKTVRQAVGAARRRYLLHHEEIIQSISIQKEVTVTTRVKRLK